MSNATWGLPYKAVTKKLFTHLAGAKAKGKKHNIAAHLFPGRPLTDWNSIPLNATPDQETGPQRFSLKEAIVAGRRLRSGKASGPDGIPNIALKEVVRVKLDVLLDVFNVRLSRTEFSTE